MTYSVSVPPCVSIPALILFAMFALYFVTGHWRDQPRRKPKTWYPEDSEINAIVWLVRNRMATQENLKRHSELQVSRTLKKLYARDDVSETEWLQYHEATYGKPARAND